MNDIPSTPGNRRPSTCNQQPMALKERLAGVFACRSAFLAFMTVGILLSAAPDAKPTEAMDIFVLRTLTLEGTPLSVAISPNGRFVYVLTVDKNIAVYSADGRVQAKMPVDEAVDAIQTGPGEDLLFLISRETKTVQIVSISPMREIDTTGSPFKGASDAPVSIAVFGDFQCPYCSRLAPVLDQVIRQHPNQVKIFFKNFPLTSHPYAKRAAQASIAAAKQDKFWEFHDRLFKDYTKLDDAKIREVVGELGLDWDRFQKDLDGPETSSAVSKDISDGMKAGVRGTPAVFVGGIQPRNTSPEGFDAAIRKTLERSKPGNR